MKKNLLTLCILCLTFPAADALNVYFVGNSYTSVNNLPVLIDSVATSAGRTYTYSSNTPGGCTFSTHCTNASMTAIRNGGWDFVVLQEQSQLPSFPQNQVDVQCLPYAAQLADSVKAHGGMPMFYMTWGRKNGDQQNAQYFPVLGTYEGMDSMLYERYMDMAIDNNSAVCPVGRVWRYLRTNHPEIELYDTDGSHPSMAGSYAAACAFYVMLFNADIDSVTYNAGLKDSVAIHIRRAVSTVVSAQYNMWLDPATYFNPHPTDIDAVDADDSGVWPNPVTDIIHAEGEFLIMDLNGKVLLRGCDSADLSSLPSGCYLLHGTKTYKFIKR